VQALQCGPRTDWTKPRSASIIDSVKRARPKNQRPRLGQINPKLHSEFKI